ncbi:helicase associated domain-containing protein [Streptomyces pharetrae]
MTGAAARTRRFGSSGLGAWIGNQRSRAATLSPERVKLLSAIGMRWT